jgi:hypothetical protein
MNALVLGYNENVAPLKMADTALDKRRDGNT